MLAAPLAQQYGPGNVVGLERLSLALKDDPLIFGVDEAGPPDTCRPARRGQHVIERQLISDELVGMDLDLDRALVAPENGHAGDTGNGEQAQADRPVGDRA